MKEDNPLLNKVDILEDSVQVETSEPIPDRPKEFVTSSTIQLEANQTSSIYSLQTAQLLGDEGRPSVSGTLPSSPEHARRNSRNSQRESSEFIADMDPTEIVAPSVGQLRDYFDNLGQSTPDINEISHGPRLRKRSYTIPRKSIQALTVNTDLVDNVDAPLDRNTSVEELRQMFERGEISKFRRGQSLERSTSPGPHLSRSSMSKSVEFFSRPPKFRTPSPMSQNKLPTPPPLPLPPSPEMIEAHFNRAASSSIRCRGRHGTRRNFVTQMNQSAQPIISMHLPFRSRSLALDRGNAEFPPKGKRLRAGSITQRSLSPVETPVDNPRNLKTAKTFAQSSNNVYATYRSALKQSDSEKRNKAVQSQTRSLIPINSSPPLKNELIQIEPKDTDGVFVRSAVVYERVPDVLDQNGPKQFVTTYVISDGPYPSRSTIQATNFWVAENALQAAKKSGNTPPYRTQPLTHTNAVNTSTRTQERTKGTQVRVPCNSKSSTDFQPGAQRPRSLSISSNVHQRGITRTPSPGNQPRALPTPPPAEIHPYILRCSSVNTSPNRVVYSWLPTKDSSIQCNRSTQYYPSPTRSWSVRSLSPPPFRTPYLSSLHGQKSKTGTRRTQAQSNLRRTQSMRLSTAQQTWPDKQNKQNSTIPERSIRQTGSYRSESERIREARERRRWMQKAESVNRERQAYHEMRGSWSPPYIRSAARYVPNDLEENTEREIRDRVKQHKPLSPIPPLFRPIYVDDCATQTPAFKVNEQVQCDYVPLTSQEVSFHSHENGGVDTTPITPSFAEKRAYFEQLIKTNKILARCSFCSDCYHCPSGQTPYHSTYASWDSDLNAVDTVSMRPHSTQTEDYSNRHRQCSNCPRASSSMDVDNDTDLYRPSGDIFNNAIESGRGGPQQYSSSFYMASKPPQSARWDSTYRDYDPRQSAGFDTYSIDHEYYAKTQKAMPKVAPNPPKKQFTYTAACPSWSTTMGNNYRTQSHAELIHSPTSAAHPMRNNTTYLSRYDYPITGAVHSPPCRFYTTSKLGSIEGLNDRYSTLGATTPTSAADLAAYRGRVKQIVCELNERDYTNACNTNNNSQEDLYRLAAPRRPLRYTFD